MISAKDLSEEQQSAMKQWAEDGSQLPDIQQRLKGQYGLNVTYMDTRLLVLDLGIDLQPEPEPEPGSEEPEAESDSPAETTPDPSVPDQAELSGRLQVTTDEMARPGAIVSGSVTFSDGEKAAWMIDETGRPGLEPDTPDYQPTEPDLIEFEKHLRVLLEG
ncbi:MAG: hypothetical protein ABGZ49_02865 [Akkermansiaceae bacterium]